MPTILRLPTELKISSETLDDKTLLWAGEKKWGKTSFIAQWPGHFILECEPGNANHVTANYVDVHNWEEAKEYLTLLEENPQYCTYACIDDVPSLYNYCVKYITKLLKLTILEALEFKGWGAIRREFESFIDRFQALKMGKHYTAHTEVVTAKDLRGREISKLETTMSKQCNEIMDGKTHFWGIFLRREKGERILVLEGDSFLKAGHGFKNHFWKNGVQLKEIDMGSSPEMAYQNFMEAYNNYGTNNITANHQNSNTRRTITIPKS